MSESAAKITLQAYFITKWTAAGYSESLVEIEGVPFEIPTTADTWVNFQVRHLSEEPQEMGISNVAHDVSAMVTARIFCRPLIGTKPIDTLRDLIKGWFRGEPVSGYHFSQPFQVFDNRDTEDGWTLSVLNMPFSYTENHTLNTP